MKKKDALYVDIDGTLARFHDADKMFIEAMWTPGFYINLKPFENLVAAVKMFKERHPDVEVFVLSSVLDTEPPFVVGEKNGWLDRYLPEIDKDHRIFTRAGEDKSQYINMQEFNCHLLDDFNKNLYEFEAAGGKGIKFRNDINHRGLGEYGGSKGNLWPGALVNYDDAPGVICRMLEKHLGILSKERADFVTLDDTLVEYIGQDETVILPDDIKEIGCNAFWNKQHVLHVEFSGELETISSGAFSGSGLQMMNLPAKLKTIEKDAFIGCNQLTSVRIPGSVSFLHNQAFNWCRNLKHIHVDHDNEKYFSLTGIVFKRDEIDPMSYEISRCPCGKTGLVVLNDTQAFRVANEAFMNCTYITDVVLPNSIVSIGDGAFSNCASLEKIALPPHTKELRDDVFAGCESLKTVVMPENLAFIGHGIFDGCKKLDRIVISDDALVRYCEEFDFLDELYLTPCYNAVKARYEEITKNKNVDSVISDANKRVSQRKETSNEDYTK